MNEQSKRMRAQFCCLSGSLVARFLARERAGTLAHTLVFLPKEAHYLGTHKHYSVFQGTTLLFSHTVSKAEVGEMPRKGEESLCFRELVSTLKFP